MRKFLLAMLSSVVLLSTAACGGAKESTSGETKSEGTAQSTPEVLKIGAVLPMTGPAAVFGKKFKEAYTLAVDEINAAGGVKGKKLEVVIEDSQEQPQLGTTAAEKLINNDEILVLTGGRSSGVTFAVAKVANDNQMPYLIDHGSTDKATMAGWDYVYRLNPTAGMYSQALRDYLDEAVKPKKVAYIQVDNAFGEAIYEYGLKKYFEERGLEILHEKYDDKALDLKAIMTKVKNFAPDAVIMTSGTDNEAVQIMKAAKEAGVSAKVFAGTGAGHSIQGFWEQDSTLAVNVLSSGPWHGDKKQQAWQDFAKNFKEKYGHAPGEHEAEGYAGIYILADAIGQAETLDRETVKKALDATDMDTTFGHVKFEDFDGYTNQNKSVTELSQWIDGELVTVYPKDLAAKEPVFPFPGW